jgi:tetratricopeptide (TPR) repeat protein
MIGAGLPAPAAAEPPSLEFVAAAKVLMLRGRSAEARSVLQDLAARYRDSNDVDFLLGMLDVEAKDYDRAVQHFRAILARQPGAVRVRLELARAFYLDRDFENAFRQFQLARAGNPPAGVIASIDRFLSLIRREKSWSYSFSAAIAPDSNINNGTSDREAIIFGLPFELSDRTRRRSGTGIAIDTGAEFAPRIGEATRLKLGVAIQRRDYPGREFDDMIVAFQAGPRLVLDKWDLSLTATGFRRHFAGRRLSEGAGAKGEASYYTDARTAISLGLSAQHIRYPHHPLYTGSAYSAWASVTRALSPESFLSARIGASRKKARADDLASWSRSISLGYYRDLPGGFSVYVEPSHSRSIYDAPDPFFGERRKDSLMELRVTALNRRLDLHGFTPRVALTFARRRSTIDLYDYAQRRLEVGVTRAF